MAKSKSSASQEEITPAGKPTASFVTETGKSGDYGDQPINCKSLGALEGTNKVESSEDFGSKGSTSFDGVSETEPQGKPTSTFINTGAVKKG